MKNENIDELCAKLDAELSKKGISRRDALKLAGITGAATMLANPTVSEAATQAMASNAKGKIVIVGAGAAGITVAAQLVNKLSNPDVTIIGPNDIHLYQPGQTLVAAGVWKQSDLGDKNADYIPSGVKWEKTKVTEFDAANNAVKCANGKTIKYDYLVIATGIEYAYERIEGLTVDKLGKNGVYSIYQSNLDTGATPGCVDTWEGLKELAAKSKAGKATALFTHPNTPIKCGGAPKKIMYLTENYLRDHGNRANVEMTFLPNGGKMFGVKEYHEAIVNQFKKRNMKWKYKHNLVKIDTENKVATFANTVKVKGAWDEDLEEYEMVTKVNHIEMKYDFIHITPPMKAPEVVKNSPFAWKKGSAAKFGAVNVTKETLQSPEYKNVFCLGDVAGIPMGKTGGSVRKQAPVLVQNLVNVMEGKAPTAKYAGYTVCPLVTGYGTVMMAEFNWTKKPTPSFPLDPAVERWIWWVLKVYMLKPMYFHGMLRGRA
jgi:sulfide:quinone oxidoreductase